MDDFQKMTSKREQDNQNQNHIEGTAREIFDTEPEQTQKTQANQTTQAEPKEQTTQNNQQTQMNQQQQTQVNKQETYYKEAVKKPKKKKTQWGKFVAGTLIVSIAGGASIGGSYALMQDALADNHAIMQVPVTQTQTASVAQPVATVSKSTGDTYSAVEIIKAVKPTVVSISTQVVSETQYFGTFKVPYEAKGMGSGVVFYSDDDRVAIATNNHVIEDATSIFVTIGEGEDEVSVPAKVVGTKSEADLAVITISWDDLTKEGIKTVHVAQFGDSDALEVGDPVIAIGNAMGMGISATDGIISMTEQSIIIEESELAVLQTSAAINSGNSGGALVNAAGEVIGINTAKYNSSNAEGMGYAIPSNEIVPTIETLLLNGTQPKPFVGITGTSITAENAALYRLPVGALIMEVTEGGPADKAGMEVGDIVTQFNGQTVLNMEVFIELVSNSEVGKEVEICVLRNGNEAHDLKIVIGDKNQLS